MDSTRTSIIEAAVDAYADDPTRLTTQVICDRAGVDREIFDSHFENVEDVLRAWYPIAIDRVAEAVAGMPDFDRLSLQDRLGSFCFMLLDQLEERLAFVKATFGHHAAGFGSAFHHRLRHHLQTILSGTDLPAVNMVVVDTDMTRFVIAESIVQMIGIWLDDESPDRARATALIDRIFAFYAEVITNRIPDKAVDLVRYAVEAGYVPLDRLPLVGDMFKRSETEV